MDYLYVFAGMFVSIVVLFKRELLIQKVSFWIIFGFSVALFLGGIVLHIVGADPNSFCGALLTPLLSLALFRFCRRFFVRRIGHEPTDTYLNWSPGLGADRLFNIVYFGLAICIELVSMGAMMELAKAGW